MIRQGLDDSGAVPKCIDFVTRTLNQYANIIANPPKPKKIDPKKAAAEEAAKRKA